jgi:hypothetical protein
MKLIPIISEAIFQEAIFINFQGLPPAGSGVGPFAAIFPPLKPGKRISAAVPQAKNKTAPPKAGPFCKSEVTSIKSKVRFCQSVNNQTLLPSSF